MFSIKERLKKLGKTQGWLILKLRENGITVTSANFSKMVNGIDVYPRVKIVLEAADRILTEVENGNPS